MIEKSEVRSRKSDVELFCYYELFLLTLRLLTSYF